MRTTLYIPDDLLRLAKKRAAEAGTTLTALVEDALRSSLLRQASPLEAKSKVTLPTFRGRGLRPGVNLDSTVDLLDTMDEQP